MNIFKMHTVLEWNIITGSWHYNKAIMQISKVYGAFVYTVSKKMSKRSLVTSQHLNEELAYKRGVARPNNMWLNLVKMVGRLSVAPSLSWLLSIFI